MEQKIIVRKSFNRINIPRLPKTFRSLLWLVKLKLNEWLCNITGTKYIFRCYVLSIDGAAKLCPFSSDSAIYINCIKLSQSYQRTFSKVFGILRMISICFYIIEICKPQKFLIFNPFKLYLSSHIYHCQKSGG